MSFVSAEGSELELLMLHHFLPTIPSETYYHLPMVSLETVLSLF